MKEAIKSWLKEHGLDRDWLAERVGAQPKTVNNWLSTSRDIPASKITLIKRAMAEEDARLESQERLTPETLQDTEAFRLEVSPEEFDAYSEIARSMNLTLKEWAILALNEQAAEYQADKKVLTLPEHKADAAVASKSTG